VAAAQVKVGGTGQAVQGTALYEALQPMIDFNLEVEEHEDVS
jgi:hypothetical protein